MTFLSSSRAGIRMPSVVLRPTARQIQGLSQTHTRLISSRSSRSLRPLHKQPAFLCARNIWSWPAKNLPPPSPPTSPEEPLRSSENLRASISNETAVAEHAAPPSSFPLPSPVSGESMVHSSSATDTMNSSTSVLNTAIPDTLPVPLHYGDLAKQGLAGWSPDGIFQWLLESVQVSTGMPWAYAIIICIITWRLALIPFAVELLQKTGRVSGRPAPDFRTKPQDQQRYDSYCLEIDRAVKSKDITKLQLVRGKINALFPPDFDLAASRVFVHILSLSSLLGIVRLFALPLEQLKRGGGFIPDLTVATIVMDPYLVLPSTFVILALSWIRIQSREVPRWSGFLILYSHLRIHSVIFAVTSTLLPVGLTLSAVTYLAFGVLQAKLLQRRGLREAFKVPSLPGTAKTQRVSPLLGWGGAEFVDDVMKAEIAQKAKTNRKEKS